MNEENKKYGYIGLWRSLLSWEWFQEPNTLSVFIYCLLRACPKEDKWKGHTIKRGSFITSLAKISKDTGLSVQQTRTALEHLETTGEITKCSTSKFTVISVKNYDCYQVDNKQNNKQSTKYQHTKQQTNNKQITTDKNKKRDILPKGNISLGKKGKNSPDVAVPGGTPQANGKPTREMVLGYGEKIGKSKVCVSEFYTYLELSKDNFENWQAKLKEWG